MISRTNARVRFALLVAALSLALCVSLEPAPASGGNDAAPDVEAAVKRARESRLGIHPQWLRLGHYRSTLFGGWESEVDGPPFFLAEGGKRDPAAELEATIRRLFVPPETVPPDEHALCAFPARAAWLTERLSLGASLPQVDCPAFREFRDRLKPASVTFIFSSYYLNNPVSMFGHTFLRINSTSSQTAPSRGELLDYGIDYSATTGTENAIAYAFKGFFGMFHGHFNAIPFYYKVREYNDYESRDLWQYDLSLSREQTGFLVMHLWELGRSHIDYWYMTENCSYHILGALEAADPRVHLTDQLPKPVLPVDTVKAVMRQPGLVRDVRYRPSIRTQFEARLRDLNEGEALDVARVFRNPDVSLLSALSIDDKRKVFDTALDLVEMKYFRQLTEEPTGPAAATKQRILERRAELGVQSPELSVYPPKNRLPHSGHDSQRFGGGWGYSTDEGGYAELQYRLALHDLVDPAPAYPETAQIEFLPLRLRYLSRDSSVHLEDGYIVRVISLSPVERFDRSLSWKVAAGATTIHDSGCSGACTAAHGEAGAGLAAALFEGAVIAFGTMDADLLATPNLKGGVADSAFRLGVGPALGLRFRFSPWLLGLIEGQWSELPFQDPQRTWRAHGKLRWGLVDGLAVGVESSFEPRSSEGGMLLFCYF